MTNYLKHIANLDKAFITLDRVDRGGVLGEMRPVAGGST